MTSTPEIPVTLSPYWLRLFGNWIHLEGVAPEVEVSSQRAFNELITVDGYRYVQRAPRGPRTWNLNYEYATASALAALEAAAYATEILESSPSSGRTILLDQNAARENMLRPDLAGPKATSRLRPVINAGGVWQPSYSSDTDSVQYSYVPVRAGVTYSLAAWTNVVAGHTVATAQLIPGPLPLEKVDLIAVGGGTPTDPEMVHGSFTPSADGEVVVLGNPPPSDLTKSVAGLMFYEGDCPPTHYRRGQRTPVQVSVQDPALTTNVIWPNQSCDPCSLPRKNATFVIQEVGTDPITELT